MSESGVIITPDQRLRVFVSSTLEELAPERRAVRDAVTSLHLVPVLFELGARRAGLDGGGDRTDTGGDAAALAARQRLAPLLGEISDPFLHAVCQLAMAWTLPISATSTGRCGRRRWRWRNSAAWTSRCSRPWPRSRSAR